MIKVTLIALAMASAVFAQSTTSSATSSASSSASIAQASGIPIGTQPRCATFLNQLNSDITINKCLTSLIGATDEFDPTVSSTAASAANQTAINQALNAICSTSFADSCPPTSIRTSLTTFYTECSTDLLGASGDGSDGNQGVIQIYDVLYLILPLKSAICTKVDGKYCLNESLTSGNSSSSAAVSGSSSSSSSAPAPSASSAKRDTGLVAADLFKRTAGPNVLLGRQASNTTQETLDNVAPSADSYRNSGLPYLFLQPNSTDICSQCTYNIIKGYITFETVTPYAIGIAHSPMLKGQLDLWNQIKTCPDNFATNLLNDATGTAAATSGASRIVLGSTVIGIVSIVGVAVSALL